MHINKFHIDTINIINYKKYTSLNLNFNHQFMLIIGENGSGKTSVLDAIATFLGGYLQAFKEISSAQRHSIIKSDIKIEIIDKDDNISVKYHTPVVIDGKCNINNDLINIKRVRKNSNKTTMTTLLKSDNKELKEIVQLIESDDNALLPIISYHGTGRLWEQEFKKSAKMTNLTRLDGYNDCLNSKSNYKNFRIWFEKMEFNAFQIGKKIPLLEAVRVSVIKMLSLLTGKEVELFIYRESDLEIKYKDEEKREKVSNLSDGYRNIIGIVSDIAYRMAILNPHLGLDVTDKTSGVVLIDEIDLHLHPKWQKEITNILTTLFPKVQFIVTTHSPFIIQSQTMGSIIKIDEPNIHLKVDATQMSLEDIAELIQQIATPQMSLRKIKMFETAKEYFEKLDLLEQGNLSEDKVKKIKDRLDEVSILFEDNMAYVAFLQRKRLVVESKL